MYKFAVVILLLGISASAQDMRTGSKEIEFFAQGGHSVSGGRGNTGAFDAGLRLGYGLFSLGSRSLRGTFEYAVEFIPVYSIVQPGSNAYGASFTPFDLKYNFTAPRRAIPFIELGGGVLFTNHDVPPQTSWVNFTPQAAIGFHLPLRDSSHHLTLALKYVHISNAGLSVPNPGVNTIQFRIGIGEFHK